jgi:excisionase family DNA binding protein
MNEADRLAVGTSLEAMIERVVRRVLAEERPASMVEGYLGTREAARRWGVGQDTVLAAIAGGRLPATRPPGSRDWRIRPADLEAFLAGQAGAQPVDFAAKRAERATRLAAAVKGNTGGGTKGGGPAT